MDIWTPPTLEELSRQVLLKNEALAISALENLSKMLFPALFKEAFSSRCTRIVKAMVAAWPFPYLPVGALMNTFNSEIFHAVLEGLDVLLTQQVCPMRGKLRVLDFRRMPREFWPIQAGTEDGNCSAETGSDKQAGKRRSRRELRPRMKVRVDLYFRSQLKEEEMYFLQWAQQRKDSLQICCDNMKIVLLSLDKVRMVLSAFKPEHIKVLELNIDWSWCTLAQFSTYLREMRNLHTLSLVNFNMDRLSSCCPPPRSDEKKFVQKFVSQFSRISSLQHLYLCGFSFFSEHMKLLLRNLKTPLETFSITHCHVFHSHLKDFALCPSLHGLKHLDMSGVLLCNVCILPLSVLLEMGADRLETLELQGCRIKDSQFRELLPALSQCSQLTKVNFYANDFSMNLLSDLLHHTANMNKMTMERYPAPRECYDRWGHVSRDTFSQLCSQLMDTLRAIRQPKRISFATYICGRCFQCCVYDQEARLCSCLQ
uniref:PRAME family member 12-like n=1 Tax=Myodes glareolus TaxID=447135 RepID=UPI00202130C7|nr:PRAME family member 12-like [Myodes glareolus]